MTDTPIENVSDTAFWVAHYRALETKRSDALFHDPLADVLAGDHGHKIARAMPMPFMTAWAIAEEFTDSVSGSKESRPALNRLLADAKRRKFDAVLVYRYDRFARSLRQLVNALSEFDAMGIHFVSLHEGVDTSTPNGRLIFGIFASIAEFERELIRSRVRSGLAAARTRGKRLGRPRVVVDAQKISALPKDGASWATI
jgi:DNA invertase Pin-like site-specific DNA recombinase